MCMSIPRLRVRVGYKRMGDSRMDVDSTPRLPCPSSRCCHRSSADCSPGPGPATQGGGHEPEANVHPWGGREDVQAPPPRFVRRAVVSVLPNPSGVSAVTTVLVVLEVTAEAACLEMVFGIESVMVTR